jgi:UDP-N-acetylmuramoyl-tripeptide--D-alanyl-D-alanine ligase
VVIGGVSIDSRRVARNDLFVALVGERSDGHAFVEQALRDGAAAAMVARGRLDTEGPAAPGPLVEVEDTTTGLLDLARVERGDLRASVLGITGSSGKTCTKDFTAAVLGRRLRVVASAASFNNEIGLPLTLLRAGDETEAVVCEMGARHPGNIRQLCDVARPDVGIVTNVGVAHMEMFGSPEALRDTKAELPEALPADGTAVLNADDAVVRGFAGRTRARVLLYGLRSDAEVRAERVQVSRESGRASFGLVTPGGSAHVELPVPGEHLVADALAAAAAGWALGIPADEAAAGLAGAAVTAGRMELIETPDGLRVINDAYNANPSSVAAALRAARWMAGDGRCVAVLGQMAELGAIAAREHERVGELAARLRIDVLVIVGPEARLIAVGAEREGVEPDRIVECDDAQGAAEAVRAIARPGDLVLVKGSRVARMERVVEALRSVGAGASPGSGRGGP